MKIIVTGASGLLGSELSSRLAAGGHSVVPASRTAHTGGISWNPGAQTLDPGLLSGVDAVVHLAGESIASGRWTAARKAAIRDSRVAGTKLWAAAVAAAKGGPKIFISASAIGYYGDRGDEVLDESSKAGTGFLPEVCQAWESAAASARTSGSRVLSLRFGVLLSKKGGALARMLLPFKLGAGGRLGSGKQWMSCISLEDAARAIEHALASRDLAGPVNGVCEAPVTNLEFTKALGRVLRRPTIFPMPAPMARLAFGELADALLLASTRVLPKSLQQSGFKFSHPTVASALAAAMA